MTKGGVDTVDQLSATYSVSRNSRRWPLTLFFSLLNSAAINAFVIYNCNTNGNLKRRYFLKDLALSLVKPFQMSRLQNPRISLAVRRKISDIQGEIVPGKVGEGTKRQTFSRRCHICPRNKDRKSFYICTTCKKFVCLDHATQICDNCIASDRA